MEANTIVVDRGALLKALDLVGMAVHSRSTIPVLQTARLRSNGVLAIEGTDLDLGVRCEIAVTGKADDMLLPDTGRVRRALATGGGEQVSLKPIPPEGGKGSPGVTVRSGDLGVDLSTMVADDHPGVDSVHFEEFRAELGEVALATLARVAPAISSEETRYYLNGICLDRIDDWTWRFVATDGHRIMMADVALPGATGGLPERAIVPKWLLAPMLKQFARTREPVVVRYGRTARSNQRGADLTVEPGRALLEMATQLGPCRVLLCGKLIDGTYPDYKRVIPSHSDRVWRFDKAALARAIQTVASIGEGKIIAVKIEAIGDGEVMVSQSSVLGTAAIGIHAEMRGTKGDSPAYGFNSRYLLEMLGSLRGDTVELAMTDAASPVVITDPEDAGFRGVLMPMRI